MERPVTNGEEAVQLGSPALRKLNIREVSMLRIQRFLLNLHYRTRGVFDGLGEFLYRLVGCIILAAIFMILTGQI